MEISAATLSYRSEPSAWAKVLVATIAAFGVRIAFAKAVALSCGFDLALSGLLVLIPILWILVIGTITIGGIGVQDAGYVALLGMLGVPAAAAVSMSVIEHLVARLAALPGVLYIGEIGRREGPVRQ